MSSKKISLAGEVHICTGSIYTTVDALKTMKCVGLAYGLYDHAEEFPNQRVILDESGERPALVVQENTGQHDTPLWETCRTVTDDPRQIQRYMTFRDTLEMLRQMETERERQPSPAKPPQPQKEGKNYER